MQSRRKNRKQDTVDSRVLSHVELETKRVKEATEAVLYDLLPAAISVVTGEDTEELTWLKSQVCMLHIQGRWFQRHQKSQSSQSPFECSKWLGLCLLQLAC